MNERPERWIWADHVRDQVRNRALTSCAGHVALALAVHYMSNDTCEAWPSQAELADTTGWSRRAVQDALHELERNGLLNVRRGHAARTSGNVYRLRNGGPPMKENAHHVRIRPGASRV